MQNVFTLTKLWVSEENWDYGYCTPVVKVFWYRSLACNAREKQARYWMKYYGGKWKWLTREVIDHTFENVGEYTIKNEAIIMQVVNRWEHSRYLRVLSIDWWLILFLHLDIKPVRNEFDADAYNNERRIRDDGK